MIIRGEYTKKEIASLFMHVTVTWAFAGAVVIMILVSGLMFNGWSEKECDECDGSGGGTFSMQLLRIDRDMLETVQEKSGDLAERDFSFNNNRLLMLGGMGYRSGENGMRIGSGAWVGYRSFESEPFMDRIIDSLEIPPYTKDTTYEEAVSSLHVIPAYMGGLIEKTLTFDPVSFYFGGMLGGGAWVVIKETSLTGDVFVDVDDETVDEKYDHKVSAAVAPFIMGELHSGVSIKMAPVFGIGVDAMMLMTYAPSGFVTGQGVGDFFTVAPGVRMRFIFGRDV